MKVYRVEHLRQSNSNGTAFAGPFGISGSCFSYEWKDEKRSLNDLPSPEKDLGIITSLRSLQKDFTIDLVCGCSSLDQLYQWFSRWELENLKSLGFCIACYEIKNPIKGDFQLLFKPTKKRKIIDIS